MDPTAATKPRRLESASHDAAKHEQREIVARDLPCEFVGVDARLTTASGAAQWSPAKAVSRLVLGDHLPDVGGLVLRQHQPRSAAVAGAPSRHGAAPR